MENKVFQKDVSAQCVSIWEKRKNMLETMDCSKQALATALKTFHVKQNVFVRIQENRFPQL